MKNKIKSIFGLWSFFIIGAIIIYLMYGYILPGQSELNQNRTEIQSSMVVGNKPDTFNCATMVVYEKMTKADPDYERSQHELETFTKNYIKNIKSKNRGVVIIPIVVHVVYNTTEQNIPNAVVQSQIDVLNKDFRRLNADTINTPPPFKPLGSDTQIEFVLAKRDPAGNPSIGITRTQTPVVMFQDDQVKYTSIGGHDIWDRDKYLNIWVCNLSILGGYAQFPGGNPASDGIVINYRVFGTIGAVIIPSSRGRVATHEAGHWFNLRHIWGDADCGNDFVDDTPTAQAPNSGCPIFPYVTCSNGPNGDMFTNYMDYTWDNCKNIYTVGQSNRMNACLNGVRSSLLTTSGGIPVSGIPIAHFKSDKMTINNGQSINFFDESGGIPTNWQWTFDGGVPSSSNLKDPSVMYPIGGFYTVKLKVTNSFGADSVNYVNYVKVLGVNMSSFSLIYPPSNTVINTSSSDTSGIIFTWRRTSLHPSIRYKWKIRRNGYPGEVALDSYNNGLDSSIIIRNSQLDSIAMGFPGGGDTLYCLWRVSSYNGTDSLLSQNQYVVYLIRHTIGINMISSSIPDDYKLYQNYPNPFNPITRIRFALPKNSFAKLVIYDMLGREIFILVNQQLNAGKYEIDWNAEQFSSGIYYYKIITNEFSKVKKMVIIK